MIITKQDTLTYTILNSLIKKFQYHLNFETYDKVNNISSIINDLETTETENVLEIKSNQAEIKKLQKEQKQLLLNIANFYVSKNIDYNFTDGYLNVKTENGIVTIKFDSTTIDINHDKLAEQDLAFYVTIETIVANEIKLLLENA